MYGAGRTVRMEFGVPIALSIRGFKVQYAAESDDAVAFALLAAWCRH